MLIHFIPRLCLGPSHSKLHRYLLIRYSHIGLAIYTRAREFSVLRFLLGLLLCLLLHLFGESSCLRHGAFSSERRG